MREFELEIKEAFKKGLSNLKVIPQNTQTLGVCKGFRCFEEGLEKYIPLEIPILGFEINYEFPFPQFLNLKNYNLLIIRNYIDGNDKIYSISDDFVSVELLATIDFFTFGDGGLYEVVDFDSYVLISNGNVLIYFDTESSTWVVSPEIVEIPLLNTVENFNGQVFAGGVKSDFYDCDETFYIWSAIGDLNFIVNKSNEAGFQRCPYGGKVLNVRVLNQKCIIGYSNKGITKFIPSQQNTSFGAIKLWNCGILNKGAVSCHLKYHLFLASNFHLMLVEEDGVKDLGFQNQMEEFKNQGEVVILFDKEKEDFYISNHKKTFLFNRFGLSEITLHPSTICNLQNGIFCFAQPIVDNEIVLETAIFDMNYRGQKTIFSIETNCIGVENLLIQILTNYGANLDWQITNSFNLNNQGICSIIISGNSFKFRLLFENLLDNFNLGYLKIRYKMTDLRGIRGVYAPPPRGQ